MYSGWSLNFAQWLDIKVNNFDPVFSAWEFQTLRGKEFLGIYI